LNTYLVAAVKPWNIEAFKRHAGKLPGKWVLYTQAQQLTVESVQVLKPRYIFFPHWSWTVANSIFSNTECVCFHMTDVPYGRGGSPLQNLIQHEHSTTMMSALRMEAELDAGPVYLKRPLSLSGRAQAIYERAADLVWSMIEEIIRTEPQPRPQEGEVVVFKRRKPAQSLLPESGSLTMLLNHIRMLDAEDYPQAFLEYGDWRLEFSHAGLQEGNKLQATVLITPKDK
jgi:methionyl-tRNA formyltransferase